LNKVVVKAHGNADEKQFYSSIKLLYNCVKNDVVEKIKSSFNNA
jgi:glycerol-3-phosphate acyltransferase PlsX